MSHEVESMFSVRETPWHGLGAVLDTPPTSEEAIQQAGLDWTVDERTVFWQSKINPQKYVEVPMRKMLVRNGDETPLSIVGKDYRVLQNTEAFGFFDPLIDAGIAEYETAGSLKEGKKIWVLARIKEDFQIGAGDTIRQYVLLCNGHDGATGVLIQPTPIRVVCNNTLMWSLGTGMVQTLTHRGDLQQKMDTAKELIGFTTQRFTEMKTAFLLMSSKEITTNQRVEYLQALIPSAPREATDRMVNRVNGERDKILELLDTGKSTDITGFDRGTVWAIYNCAVEFADWYMGNRAKDIGNYQLFGRGAIFKQRALQLALQLAKGEPLLEPPRGLPGENATQVSLDDDEQV